MNGSRPAGRRLRIDRLDLDLRGITPATAEAAARRLGPALTEALTSRRAYGVSADRIDAGRVESPASPDPHDLAVRIARRVAHLLEREGK